MDEGTQAVFALDGAVVSAFLSALPAYLSSSTLLKSAPSTGA